MREVLAARHDRDFVVAAPARRPRPKPVEKAGLGQRAMSFALRHPVEILVTLILAGAGGAIAWNALALQTARHPAPLFSPRVKADPRPDPAADLPAPLPPMRPAAPEPHAAEPAVAPAAPPVAAPVTAPVTTPIAPRPASRDAIGDLIRTGEPPAAARPAPPALPPARPAPATVTTPQKPSAARDPIGDLLRLGDSAPIPPGYVGKPEPSRTVTAGQRALAKLGYTVTADGIWGPATRQAIEQFERERRLPVTGEFGPRTIRELSAQSGLPVE